MWGAAVLEEAFQETLHPTRRRHPLERLGLVTRSSQWGRLWSALSSLVQNRPQSVASDPGPTGLPQHEQLDIKSGSSSIHRQKNKALSLPCPSRSSLFTPDLKPARSQDTHMAFPPICPHISPSSEHGPGVSPMPAKPVPSSLNDSWSF